MNTIHKLNARQLNVNLDMEEVEEDMDTGTHTFNLDLGQQKEIRNTT